MEKIIPTKYYSGREVQKIVGIKSRQYITKYIDEGFLLAIQTGTGAHRRYSILGTWLIDFKERYDAGLTKKISEAQMKSVIKMADAFKNKLK